MSVAKVFSVLGNPKSLVPLAVKDSANCAGMTAASSITSREEGKDRFIDEVGTGLIWIGGIPVFKKVIDKTLFKVAGYDPKYDVRNLNNQGILDKTKEYAQSDKVKSSIEKISKNQKVFKGLNIAKFVISTVATLGAYNALTDYKQKYTHKKVKEKLLKQQEQDAKARMSQLCTHSYIDIENSPFANMAVSASCYNNTLSGLANNVSTNTGNVSNTNSNNNVNGNNQNTNFKGLADVMLDPVKNTLVLDAGITSERLTKSRSPQELVGYGIKEGGFLFFMYYLGKKIQDVVEGKADRKYNKNIGLDARVIEDEKFKASFADGSIESSLNAFERFRSPEPETQKWYQRWHQNVTNMFKKPEPNPQDVELYDFIHNNPDNMVVKVAKQSDIIETVKDTGAIDTRKYIDMDEVRTTHKNMSKLYKQYSESGQTVEEFFNGVRKLKRASVLKNIGSTIFALGVVLPSIMLADRFLKPDNKEFAVEKEVRAQLNQENAVKNAA